MCIVYVTTSAAQKSENKNIWTIKLNNYKTVTMRVINSIRNL